jgi:hypothetical protein
MIEAVNWPRILWASGAVLLVVMVVHVGALIVTGGPLTGPVSLRKPATFAETGWLGCWSVALLLPVLRLHRWQEHLAGAAVVLFGVGETSIIGIEAWRGVPSHYNFATPLDAALMRGGAAGTAGIFLVGAVVLLVAAARSPLQASVRLGTIAGVGVLLVGCVVGFVMISNNSGIYQGAFGTGFANRTAAYLGPEAVTIGPEYLLVRPATRGGDLVVPHAIGVHGLVLLAVPAVLLARTPVHARRQLQVVAIAAGAVVVALTILLGHAARQLPLDRLDPAAIAALAVCAVALAASYAAIGRALLARRRTVDHGTGSTG